MLYKQSRSIPGLEATRVASLGHDTDVLLAVLEVFTSLLVRPESELCQQMEEENLGLENGESVADAAPGTNAESYVLDFVDGDLLVEVSVRIEGPRISVKLLVVVDSRNGYPDVHARLDNEGFSTGKGRGQLEGFGAEPVENVGLGMAAHRLVEDSVQVRHRVDVFVGRFAFGALEYLVDLRLKTGLDVGVDYQLVGDDAHLGGGRVEAAEEEDERLGRHLSDVQLEVLARFACEL